MAGLQLMQVLPPGTKAAEVPGSAAWPDTVEARLETLALLQSLNADLLSHDSATLTLDRWCDTHRLGNPARIVADRDRSLWKTPTDEQRRILRVDEAATVGYRRVRLRCGIQVLSEADNWYVPTRLTPEMNRQLDASDIPFGRIVETLRFRRQTLAATLLWRPLPEGWDEGRSLPLHGTGTLDIPAAVLEHLAVLALPDGTPFCLLLETYTKEILGVPRARR